MTEEEYIRPVDVAKRLGVSRQAIYKWIREGRLKAVRFGSERGVRIPRSALEEFERLAAKEYNPNESRASGLVAVPV